MKDKESDEEGKTIGLRMVRSKAGTKTEVTTAFHYTYSKYNTNIHNIVLFYKICKKYNEVQLSGAPTLKSILLIICSIVLKFNKQVSFCVSCCTIFSFSCFQIMTKKWVEKEETFESTNRSVSTLCKYSFASVFGTILWVTTMCSEIFDFFNIFC